jgi:hypothetical protein
VPWLRPGALAGVPVMEAVDRSLSTRQIRALIRPFASGLMAAAVRVRPLPVSGPGPADWVGLVRSWWCARQETFVISARRRLR